MLYRYIFKKDLAGWESKGWEYCKDIKVMGNSMINVLGLEECLIRKEEDNEKV